ncbi:MAG: hypothetical protein ACREBG_22405 [Pyrinomonadaceae bacterium]
MITQTVNELLLIAFMAALLHSGACQVGGTMGRTKVTEEQVAALLESEFGGLFKLDTRTISPSYIVGDFNGDGTEDIAIPVRLNLQLSTEDKTKPPFSFEKAQGPGPSTLGEQGHESGLTMGDLARYKELPILVIIHGSMKDRWKNSRPEQRFVVVDAWRLGKKVMSLNHGKLKPTPYGDEPQVVEPPRLLGDAILMLDPANAGTAVYWDGARYRWYPVDEPPS